MKNYGVIELTVASPAQSFTEPITVSDAAGFLNLPVRDPADAQEDALIEAMITTARQIAENEYGRELITKQYDLYIDSFYATGCFYTPQGYASGLGVYGGGSTYGGGPYRNDQYSIELPRPLASVDLIRYRDSDGNYHTAVENGDYIVDLQRGLIMPTYGNSWPSFTPWPSSAVLVRFTSGYSASHPFWANDGHLLMLGMRQLISMWFNNRLPFEAGMPMQEFPYSVTSLFRYGAKRTVR